MNDKELEEYINKIEPNFNSHLEKGTIEMSNEYYNLVEEKMVRLINKNQELKKENKILRENAEHNDKVVDKVNWENLKLKNQQKEFIEYLNSYIELLSNDRDLVEEVQKEILEEVLLKYEEIIGGKYE